jgi:hypothetical protein
MGRSEEGLKSTGQRGSQESPQLSKAAFHLDLSAKIKILSEDDSGKM